jgi:hypothetical protein
MPFLLLFVLFNFCSCRKEYSYEDGPKTVTDSTITDSTLFIDVTIDGKRYFAINSREENEWNWILTNTRSFNLQLNKYFFLSSFTTGLGKTIHYDSWYADGVPQFYFSKTESGVDIALNNTNSTNVFTFTSGFLDNFFKIGQSPYSISGGKDTTFTPYRLYGDTTDYTRKLLGSGVQITWIDSTGKIWQTSNGPATQTGSNFTITENNYFKFFDPSFNGYAGTTVAANFDCMLYDDNGNSLPLKNGRFRLWEDFFQH